MTSDSRRLIGTAVDDGEKIALFDRLSFGELDALKLAIDPGRDVDRIVCLHGPKTIKVN